MSKTLYILRHAKAELGLPAQDDFDRALAPSGIEAATALAAYMAEHKLLPEKVWCSSALRTRQTLAAMQQVFAPALNEEHLDILYNASAGEMLNMVAVAPDSISSLMIVAHNPGVHQLALKLAKIGDDKKLDILAIKYPTCTLAIVQFDGVESWKNIASSRGRLIDLALGKE